MSDNRDASVHSQEYQDLLSALQEIVRKAYVLGRSEALKQVIDVMQRDETAWKQPLALPAPPRALSGPDAATAPVPPAATPGLKPDVDAGTDKPWWQRTTAPRTVKPFRRAGQP